MGIVYRKAGKLIAFYDGCDGSHPDADTREERPITAADYAELAASRPVRALDETFEEKVSKVLKTKGLIA